MAAEYRAAGSSRQPLTDELRSPVGERRSLRTTGGDKSSLKRSRGYYEVETEAENEADTGDSSEDDGDDEDEIHASRLRKPILFLSDREKNDICRYKNMKPGSSMRQISEHFTQLWNKIVCRRSIYDVLIQNEQWAPIEKRAHQDSEFTAEDPVEDIENLLYDWVKDIIRAGARVWDEDVRNAAANIRDIRSLKGFMPSATWLNDFKYRHKLGTAPNDGRIVIRAVDHDNSLADARKRQIRIDIGDGLLYHIDVGSLGHQEKRVPPHSQSAAEPYVRRGGPHVPPNRITDFKLSDSDDEDDDSVSVGLQPAPEDLGLEALVGATCGSSFHDVLKHLVYGPSVMTEKAQEMMAAATGVAMREELFEEGSGDKKRCARRAKLTAVLIEKVLEAKKRRDEAKTEMYQEMKLRDLNAFKVAEEKRKRYIERRELHMVQKRILDTEERFYSDQQRNELIRRELLLIEDPIATTELDSGKKAKILQQSGTPVKRQKLGLATVVGGAE